MLIGDFARLGQVSMRMLRHYDQIELFQARQCRRVEQLSLILTRAAVCSQSTGGTQRPRSEPGAGPSRPGGPGLGRGVTRHAAPAPRELENEMRLPAPGWQQSNQGSG